MYEKYALIIKTVENLYNQCGVLDATEELVKHVDYLAMDQLFYA